MSAHVLSDKAITGLYYQRLEEGGHPWFSKLAVEIDSNQDSENHTWLGMPPQLREWIGGKQAKSFRDFSYEIKNNDYESTIQYHERDLAEDKTGQLKVRIADHTKRVLSHPASLLSNLLLSAESTLCYDGQYYFDTDHSEGDSGSQSNDVTFNVTTPTAPAAVELMDAILKSIETMYGFKDDQGEPLNEEAMEFLVMVPTRFWAAALSASTSNTVEATGGGAVDNVIVKQDEFKLNIVQNPRLNSSWTAKFATFRTDGTVKPFIDQVREEATIKVLGDGSDHYFNTRQKQVSVEKAGAVGFGLWQHAVLTTLT